ncbi:hypothetical protein GCM10027570_13730 [Streptomonospora sediminis]
MVLVESPVARERSLMPISGRRGLKHFRIATARSIACTPGRAAPFVSAPAAARPSVVSLNFAQPIDVNL